MAQLQCVSCLTLTRMMRNTTQHMLLILDKGERRRRQRFISAWQDCVAQQAVANAQSPCLPLAVRLALLIAHHSPGQVCFLVFEKTPQLMPLSMPNLISVDTAECSFSVIVMQRFALHDCISIHFFIIRDSFARFNQKTKSSLI